VHQNGAEFSPLRAEVVRTFAVPPQRHELSTQPFTAAHRAAPGTFGPFRAIMVGAAAA